MKAFLNNPSLLALATLVGTIVGAGIFGLPYAIAQSGALLGLFYFAVLGGVVLLLHLFFGEFALRTEEKHRLPGYAEIYLGKQAKYLATFAIVFSVVGALLAYTIIGGEFLQTALSPVFEISEFWAAFLFWAALSFFIFQGIQLIAKAELFMVLALFAVIGLVVVFAIPHIEPANFSAFEAAGMFLPYGVILFALTGWSAIPEIADLFKKRKDRERLDNVIVWASAMTIALSAAFAFAVVGVSGGGTTEDALSGLVPFLGEHVIIAGALFGLLAVAASFLVLGNYLKNSLRYDFRVPYLIAASVATLVPLALFLLGVRSFATVVDIVGTLSLGAIEGVLIVLIYRKAKQFGKRDPEYSFSFPSWMLWGIIGLLIGGALVKAAYIGAAIFD